MSKLSLYFATNRNHIGSDQWIPEGYGTEFSSDGRENLRFGKVELSVKEDKVNSFLNVRSQAGVGDGEGLAKYLARRAKAYATVSAFRETIDKALPDGDQAGEAEYGSIAMFEELKQVMTNSHDVLIFVHGFNVSWTDAVGSAVALQEMLNRGGGIQKDSTKSTVVVLFTWPSDGKKYPFHSYRSDQMDAKCSGLAVGRGMLKLRDFLIGLRKNGSELCNQELHLLCHSMGNYVLQNALTKISEFSAGKLERVFEHIFLCAPDVDDDALEPNQCLGRLYELARNVTVYFNRGDLAMYVSDYTKGNPDRLGTTGLANPAQVHAKVHQVDCSRVVHGVVEHGYYLTGKVHDDIRSSVEGDSQYDRINRIAISNVQNAWLIP